MSNKKTHYGNANQRRQFDYYTMNVKREGITVYGWGVHDNYGVLAGQVRKVFCDHFDSEAQAIEVYGDMNFSSVWTEPTVNLNHLPDDGDGW